jgi:hypothetical protein
VRLTEACLLQLDPLGVAFAMRSYAKLGCIDHVLQVCVIRKSEPGTASPQTLLD